MTASLTGGNIKERIIGHRRVDDDVYDLIESDLMKVSGVSAVLSVFGKTRTDSFSFNCDSDQEVTLVASILIGEGVDIKTELDDEITNMKNGVENQPQTSNTNEEHINEDSFYGDVNPNSAADETGAVACNNDTTENVLSNIEVNIDENLKNQSVHTEEELV